jgi:PPIC-type PPIASE domain
MRIRPIVVLLASVAAVAACSGLREALTAHEDVVARAGDAELSVIHLGDIMGNSPLRVPPTRDVARLITDLWVDYHLLATAAANNDTLKDTKLIDDASLGIISNIRLRRYMDKAVDSTKADAASETTYGQGAGNLFVARHILFTVPGGATQAQKDSVRRRAESVRAQLTSGNFAAMAKKYSGDPGSAQRGGDLGAFQRTDMVKEFGDAVAALKPGQISAPIETQFGYHIIQRPTYADARGEYDAAYGDRSRRTLDSTYLASVDATADIQVKQNGVPAAREAARDPRAHINDDDVMATFRGGSMSVGRFARWLQSFPPQMRVGQQIAQSPDTIVKGFVKSIARNEVLLKKADSANVQLTADEKQDLYNQFKTLIVSLWQQIGVDPRQLADSAKNGPERLRLASARADAFLDRILAGQGQPVSVPEPAENVLMSKYKSQVNPAGVDRAVERAQKLRSTTDSSRASQPSPRSRVPMPPPAQMPTDTSRRDTSHKRP